MSDYEKYESIHILPTARISNKDNKPDPSRFAVVSPCFYDEDPEMVQYARKTFDIEKINYITYGNGEKFTNKVYTNLIRLLKCLEEIEEKYPAVLIMDAYDTFYLGGSTILTLLSKYRNLLLKNPVVVISAEKRCYPEGSDIFYAGKPQRDMYLNSGLILGLTNLIKVMIREMISTYDLQRFEKNDESLSHNQIYWHRYYNEGSLKDNIYIDYENKFFCNLNSCNPYLDFELINNVNIKIKKTGGQPKIFHFNRCFFNEYKQFFGEFWVDTLRKKGLK